MKPKYYYHLDIWIEEVSENGFSYETVLGLDKVQISKREYDALKLRDSLKG